jgi:hypothetical protein
METPSCYTIVNIQHVSRHIETLTFDIAPSAGKYIFEDSGEKMAASETIQTISSLRDRLKTWYCGGGGVWLSSLTESKFPVASDLSSCGERQGLELTEFAEIRGSLSCSVELKDDMVGYFYIERSKVLHISKRTETNEVKKLACLL